MKLLITVGYIGFIFARSLQTGVESAAESGAVLTWLLSWFPFPITEFAVRKAAHFSEYALLGGLLFWNLQPWLKNSGKLLTAGIGMGLLVAITDENIQRFVPGRSGQTSDVFIDVLGVTAGMLVFLVIFRILVYNKTNYRVKMPPYEN